MIVAKNDWCCHQVVLWRRKGGVSFHLLYLLLSYIIGRKLVRVFFWAVFRYWYCTFFSAVVERMAHLERDWLSLFSWICIFLVLTSIFILFLLVTRNRTWNYYFKMTAFYLTIFFCASISAIICIPLYFIGDVSYVACFFA